MFAFRDIMREAWVAVRWSVYFLILLLPVVLILAGVVALICRTPSLSPWLLLLIGPFAAGISILGAALWDGPTGRLGRPVWLTLGLLTGIWLLLAILKNSQRKRETTLHLPGRPLTVALTAEVIARAAQRKFRYRDLLRLHLQRVADDRVLIGV